VPMAAKGKKSAVPTWVGGGGPRPIGIKDHHKPRTPFGNGGALEEVGCRGNAVMNCEEPGCPGGPSGDSVSWGTRKRLVLVQSEPEPGRITTKHQKKPN